MSQLRTVLSFMNKDFKTARSYRIGFVTGLFGAFWGLLGLRVVSKLVNGGPFAGSSVAYFNFVVIGVAIVFILEPTAIAGGGNVRSDQTQGTLEYLVTMPVPRLVLGLCWSAYAFVQSVILAMVVLAFTVVLGFRVSHVDWLVAIPTVLLTLVICLAIGIFGTAIVLALQQGQQLTGALVAFLTLISGTLFPTSELPSWIQPLVHLSPFTYTMQALRSSLLSNQPHTSFSVDLIVLLGFAVVLVPASGWALERALQYARRRGSLSTF
jgi:ABC-2 type transport system permease protein